MRPRPGPLLEQFGLDPARLAQPLARLSIPRYMRLGHAAIALTGNPALGLRMGQLSRLSQVGLAGVTAAQAPTVREAHAPWIRFEPLYGSNYRGQSSLARRCPGRLAAVLLHQPVQRLQPLCGGLDHRWLVAAPVNGRGATLELRTDRY